MLTNEVTNELNSISNKIIGAAIEAHKTMGPGLLESVYEECLCHEFEFNNLNFERQKSIPIIYKGKIFDNGFRADLLNYLKLSDLKLGLIVNFNVPILKNGIRRIVNGL